MDIEMKKDGGQLTAVIRGRIDTNTAPQAEKAITGELAGISELILDFEGVEYISSAGLRVLLLCHKTMAKQGTMKIRNVNEVVKEIFDVTGFMDILNIETAAAS